jgi:acetyltransferase-like isoleucine patch superfamily enzyme
MQLLRELYQIAKRWQQQRAIKHRLLHSSKVKIEDGVVLDKKVKIGAYSFIGAGVLIGPATAAIGKFCSIGSGSVIGPNSHDLKKVTTSTVPFVAATPEEFSGCRTADKSALYRDYKAQLNQYKALIEDDVWLGHNAIVMPGVRVGTGAVVGSAAVVTKDVAPYSIVAGVPAKLVRMRFAPATVDALLEHRLYQRDPDQLLALFNRYAQQDLEAVLSAFLADLCNIPLQLDGEV